MMISSLAEEYYFMAGYIGWADITDPAFSTDTLENLLGDSMLVGLRYDVTQFDANLLLERIVRNNYIILAYAFY
ncbi:unnamed protein product [Protopolystoma xenopodis]|uniref:Uncharacterized protein n=1 Tax=Protopolystoma xenopodis TaxID=117903 RepID=A0A3S5AG76_9PLAT|nr:unnamed protein product [Protopolystoma xenopodis]